MAVSILRRKIPLTHEEKVARSKRYRVSRYGVWIDPYPHIPGTRPEKMIYAKLVEMGIPFTYQQYLKISIPDLILESDQWYLPDFVIPSRKMIIEANGAYWHTKPSQIDQDAFKYALYEMMGYKVIIWWDYEIEDRLDELLAREGLYYTGVRIVPPVRSDGKTVKDGHDAAIAMGLARRKPWTKKPVMLKSRKRKKNRRRYDVGN